MRVRTCQKGGLVQLLAVLFLIAPLADAGPLTDFLDRARARSATPSPTLAATPAPTEVKKTPAPTSAPTKSLTKAPTRKPLFNPKATPVPELPANDDDEEDVWDGEYADGGNDPRDDDDEEEATDDGWDDDDEGLWDDFTWPPTAVAPATDAMKDSVAAPTDLPADDDEEEDDWDEDEYGWSDDDDEEEATDDGWDDDDEGLWDDFTWPPTAVAPATDAMKDSVVALDTATPIPTEPPFELSVMPADDDFRVEGEYEGEDDDLENDEDLEDMMEDDPEVAEEKEFDIASSEVEEDDDLEEGIEPLDESEEATVGPVEAGEAVTPAEKGDAAAIDDDEEANDDDVAAEPMEENAVAADDDEEANDDDVAAETMEENAVAADDDEEEEKEEHNDDDEEHDDDDEEHDNDDEEQVDDVDDEEELEVMGKEDDAVISEFPVEAAVEVPEEETTDGDRTDGTVADPAEVVDAKATRAPTAARSPAPTNGVPIVDPDGVGTGLPPDAVAEGGLPGAPGGGLGQGGGNLPGVPNLGGVGNGPIGDMITGGAKDGTDATPMTGEEGSVTNPTSGVDPTDTTSGGGKTTTTNITPPTAPPTEKEDKILPIDDALPADGTLNEQAVMHSGAAMIHTSVLAVLATAAMAAVPLLAF
ncbi:Hypothetical protein NocV09_05400080 [Nannochloropsis oceanica]